MATSLGELNEEETKRLVVAFDSKLGKDHKCIQCGHDEITIVTQIVSPLTENQSGIVHATLYVHNMFHLNRHLPCVTTLCNNCGNVQYYALDKLGVELDDMPPMKEAEDGN